MRDARALQLRCNLGTVLLVFEEGNVRWQVGDWQKVGQYWLGCSLNNSGGSHHRGPPPLEFGGLVTDEPWHVGVFERGEQFDELRPPALGKIDRVELMDLHR